MDRSSAASPRPEAGANGASTSGEGTRSRTPAPDREVLERVRARDPEALGVLFDSYFEQIFGLVLRLLGNRAAAEDATQEVFLKVHRAADRLDPERNPGPWLMTIATNVCRDLWRSASHKMERQSSSLQDRPEILGTRGADSRTPHEDLEAAERRELVQEALMELPEGQREVVVLHDYEGLGHDEIAGVLGLSHAAVRKRYSRALSALGELLQERMT